LLLCALVFPGRPATAAEPETAGSLRPGKPAGSAGLEMEFWPKRLDPETSPLLYLQLSVPDEEPVAEAECSGKRYSLGNPIWSHPEGLLHAFDLEWTLPRTRTTCTLIVTGAGGRLFTAEKELSLRPGLKGLSIRDVTPAMIPEDEEAVVEIRGQGFGKVVEVEWVSASQFVHHGRSARIQDRGPEGSIIVPFSAPIRKAAPGQYLVVVENRSGAAAVHLDFFSVAAVGQASIDNVSIVKRPGGSVLLLEGTDLDGIESAFVEAPSGKKPLTITREEGTLLPTLAIRLGKGDEGAGEAFLPELVVEGSAVRVLLRDVTRVEASPPHP
jgi:hypothetical protein